jgi:hypothetical protein
MSPTSPIERDNNLAEMHSLIARDLAASNDLAARITQLRHDIAEGKPQPPKKVDLLERSNKDMTKELVLRVERIESLPAGSLGATDREMLQALDSRLAVCDLQAMRLAELRDLEFTARNTKERAYLEAEVNEGTDVAGQEPVEELAIGHASKHAVDKLGCDTKEHRKLRRRLNLGRYGRTGDRQERVAIALPDHGRRPKHFCRRHPTASPWVRMANYRTTMMYILTEILADLTKDSLSSTVPNTSPTILRHQLCGRRSPKLTISLSILTGVCFTMPMGMFLLVLRGLMLLCFTSIEI